MKAVIFLHVLYLILMRTFMVKGVTKCESKVELRAVLLSCPPKDSGCEDDDPLSQAMKSEESQILQANSKNFESLREEKERGFPNTVKDCKRKLIITLKVKNYGKVQDSSMCLGSRVLLVEVVVENGSTYPSKAVAGRVLERTQIPCDDEYIVVDHVFDPITGGKGRLLSPVVLKLRQEQMIQLYRLQFQRVVNSDPFEEQKAADKTCSVDPENPTCGIAMYDGKPIPFSEGFCCSTDPHVNAKRQLSPVSHGDSLLYRDSKLISQGNSHLVRGGEKSSAIVNPELVRLKSGTPDEASLDKKGSNCGGISDPRNWDKLPNFLLERDRKIVCDRGDFMNELCRLQEDKNKAESDVRGANLPDGGGSGSVGMEARVGGIEVVLDKPELTTLKAALNSVNPTEIDQVKNVVVLKGMMKAPDVEQATPGVDLAEKYVHVKGSRGKRENRKENKKLSLEEKLERFASAKKHLTKRRKRLLELSRKRFRKAGDQCGSGQECQTMTATDYMQDDYVRSPPPKYFFCHDKFIIDPLESPEAVMNTTCRTPDELNYDGNAGMKDKKYHYAVRNQIYKNLGEDKPEKMQKTGGFYQKQGKVKMKEKYLVGKIVSKKDRVSHNEGGRIENSIGRGKVKAQELEDPLRQTVSLRGDKRFSLYRGSGERGVKDEMKVSSGQESLRRQKNRFHGTNIKGFLYKGDPHEKKLVKPRIRNFFMARNRERQNFRSELVKGQKKLEVNHKEKEGFEGKNYKELLKEDAKKTEGLESEPKKAEESEETLDMKSNEENRESPEISKTPEMSEIPQSSEKQQILENTDSSEKADVFGITTKKFDIDRIEYPLYDKLPKEEAPSKPVNKYLQKFSQANLPESRSRSSGELSPNIDFNVEIIRNTIPEVSKRRHYSPISDQHLKNRMKASSAPLESKVFDIYGKPGPLKTRLNLYYKPREKYYIIKNDHFSPQDVYLIQGPGNPFAEGKNRQYYPKERPGVADRAEVTYNPIHYKKPSRRYYVPLVEYAEKESSLRQRQALPPSREDTAQESREKRYSELLQSLESEQVVEGVEDSAQSPRGKGRHKRSASYSFEPARGFLRSELESGGGEKQMAHELEGCMARQRVKKGSVQRGESWAGDVVGWRHENLSIEAKKMSTLEELERRFGYPLMGSRVTEKREKKRRATDKERLAQSYLNAADYVLEEVRGFLKGKRETVEQNKVENSRGDSTCEKDTFAGEYTQDTAHCMRFGDLWYSLYSIKRPVVAQIVGIQLYDKHSQCDGTSQWRELTKGKMIRIGTFLPKAEDEVPSISMSFVGGKTKKIQSSIDPENYLLLIPSHVSDTSKVNSYPQLEAGPEEYLLVESKDVSLGGECNMIGTSFEAFARQPDRCAQRKGSCLKRQPVDLWREDMEARIRGKRGKYFVENFGSVPNSPVKTYTNLTGEFLALEYYGEYTSVIEIEVKADSNAIIRKGSNAQIPLVYIDSTYPKKTRIMLSVLNIGLTASYFRPRLGDCPPDLDPAWCPLEGPLVIIPPQQRHDFKLDLSGILPSSQIFMSVQVLNQLNRKIAHRQIVIKKGDRCVCAFHCKCNCVGNLISGKTCQKLSLNEYRKAGYIGQYPFRGGAATSASESILGNIHVVFLTACYVLLFLGVMKGLWGIVFRRIGIAGTRVITGPRQLCQYYEGELQCCSVLYDDCGFPIHPTTCQPVQIVPLWLEMIINFLFFFLYPLRGIWFLIMSLPCCKGFCIECDGCARQEEDTDADQKCSRPLLSKCPQHTCVHYNLTTFNAKKSKQDEYLPYLPYKGDDDPLEEDDTEYVLQEMKRYRKK